MKKIHLLAYVLIVLGMSVVIAQPVMAWNISKLNLNYRQGYFTRSTSLHGFNGCGGVDGHQYKELICSGIPASVNTKAEFISFIKSNLDGGGHYHIAASFIVWSMLGQKSTGGQDKTLAKGSDTVKQWEDRINQSQVSVSRQNYKYSINTAYVEMNNGSNDVAFYKDSGTAPSLVFKYSGKIKYVLKISCANPLGNLPGIPTGTTSTDWRLTPDVTVSDGSGDLDGEPLNPGASYSVNSTITNNTSTTDGLEAFWRMYLVVGSADWDPPSEERSYSVKDPFLDPSNATKTPTQTMTLDGTDGGGTVSVRWLASAGSPPGKFKDQALMNISGPAQSALNDWVGKTVCYVLVIESNWQKNGGANSGLRSGFSCITVQANTPPDFTVTGNCDDGIVVTNANDDDFGATSLPIEVYKNGSKVGEGSSSDGFWSYKPTSSPSGTYIVRLYDLDYGGNKTGNYTDHPVALRCFAPSCDTTGISELLLKGVSATVSPRVKLNGEDKSVVSGFAASAAGPSSTTNYAVTDQSVSDGVLVGNVTLTPASSGNYTVSWTVSSSYMKDGLPNPLVCGDTTLVGTQPYFQISGGDLLAGGTDSITAKVASWNRGVVGNFNPWLTYSGARSNLAIIATGRIQGVATGIDIPSVNLTPNRLSFATATQSGDYGGGFKNTAIPKIDNTAPSTIGLLPFTGFSNGTFTGGDISLNTADLSGGMKTTIVATGNVYITGNITYTYSSLADIPRLTIYAKNIILTSSAVSEIHGIFHAKETFYSCGQIEFNDLNTPSVSNTCNGPLTVYGAVSAKQLVLTRTNGSWHDGTGPAEQFVQGPETWLTNPNSTGTLNNYVSLPPVL